MVPASHVRSDIAVSRAEDAQHRVAALMVRVETEAALSFVGAIASDVAIADQFEQQQAFIDERLQRRAASEAAKRTHVRPGIGASVFMAVSFMLLFTGFGSAQSLLAVLLPGLGLINLAVVYYTFAAAALFAPLAIMTLAPKWCIVVAQLFYVLWIAALWSGLAGVTLTASALLGMAAAVLWTSLSVYLTRLDLGSKAFNAFFMVYAGPSNILGAVLGGIVLTLTVVQVYLATMIAVAAAGFVLSMFAPSVLPLPGEASRVVTLQSFLRPFKLALQPKMLLMACTVICRASTSAFLFGVLPVLLPSLNIIAFVNIAFAVVQFISQIALLVGLYELLAVRWWSVVHTAAVVAAMVMAGASLPLDPSSRVIIMYFVAGVLGVADASSNAIMSSFFSTLFPKDPTSAFSLYRSFEPLCTASFFLLATFTPPLVVVLLCAVSSLASMTCLWVLQSLLQRERMQDVVVTQNPLFKSAHPA